MKNKLEKIVIILVVFGIVLFQVFNYSYSLNKEDKIKDKVSLFNKVVNNNMILEDSLSDGLQKNNDNYYFRGNVVNNYVIINNELWRIVSLNNDGSIKIIKEHSINNKLYKYSNDYNNINYLNSNIYLELISWYEDNLKNIDKYILERDYCTLYNNGNCIEEGNFKIGLLTIEDVIKAGGVKGINNDLYYLYNGEEWWILNSSYDDLIGSYFSSYVNDLGSIEDGFVDEEKGIRPVVILDNISYLNGDGTLSNPYVIE